MHEKEGKKMRLPVIVLSALSMMVMPVFAAESWKDVPLVDTQCAPKVKEQEGHGDTESH